MLQIARIEGVRTKLIRWEPDQHQGERATGEVMINWLDSQNGVEAVQGKMPNAVKGDCSSSVAPYDCVSRHRQSRASGFAPSTLPRHRSWCGLR